MGMSDCVSRQTIAQFEYAVTDSRKTTNLHIAAFG